MTISTPFAQSPLHAAFLSGVYAQQEAYVDEDLSAFSTGHAASDDADLADVPPASPANSVSEDDNVHLDQPTPSLQEVPMQQAGCIPECLQAVQHRWAERVGADAFRTAWYWYIRATTDVATLDGLGIKGSASDPFSGCSFCAQLPPGTCMTAG